MMKPIFFVYFCLFFSSCNRPEPCLLLKDNILEINSHLKKAEDNSFTYAVRKQYVDSALVLNHVTCSDSIARLNYFKIANRYYNIYELEPYREVTTEVLKKSISAQDTVAIAKSYKYLGDYFLQKEIPDSAFYFYLRSYRFSKSSEVREHLLLDMATLKSNAGDYIGAENLIAEAFTTIKHNPRSFSSFRAYNLLGYLSMMLDDPEHALQWYNKALLQLPKVRTHQHNHDNVVVKNNIACVYEVKGQYNKGVHILSEILQEQNLYKDRPELYATVLDNLAYLNFKKKSNSKYVEQWFQNALQIKDKLHLQSSSSLTKQRLAAYYLAIGKKNESYLYAHAAYNCAVKSKDLKITLDALQQLVYSDPTNAVKHINRYIPLRDNLQRAERRMHKKFSRVELETEELIIERNEAIKEKWLYLGASSTALCLMTLLLVIYRQKFKQKELKYSQDQQTSNEEIYQLLLVQQKKVMEGRQYEKSRISRDLHDGVMNQLTSTRLNLFKLRKNRDPETIEKCLPFIEGLKDIEEEVRNISHDLHKDFASGRDNFNIIIESLLKDQDIASNAKHNLFIDPHLNWEKLSGTLKINIYRILQECLQNINKHAQAKNIDISFKKIGGLLHIDVIDDGVGFDMQGCKNGIGLKNLRNRVAALEGTFEIQAALGEGVKIKLVFTI